MRINKGFLHFLYACVHKDKRAWNIFAERYSPLIYNYIIRALRMYHCPFNDDEVADIFDTVFLALLEKDCKKLKEFRGQNERSFRAYLREITFHMTIDFLRKQRHFVNIEKVQGVIPDKRNKERLYIKELEEMIVALSAKLPKRQRFLFNLMFKEGLGQSQIAHLMELKLNAVHQLRHRMINNMIKFVREKHLVGDS